MKYIPMFLLVLQLLHCVNLFSGQDTTSLIRYPVGAILDMDSPTGKIGGMCMSMAISDFYARHTHYKTRLVLHARDSLGEPFHALSSAINLLENERVQAIIGPQSSEEAELLVKIGDKAKVPIISFSVTSPFLSRTKTPYFVRVATNDNSQVNVIAAIVQAFKWREVIIVHEDTVYGNGIVPNLILGLEKINAHVPYHSLIPPFATEDYIVLELYKLMTMSTRIFVVHMSTSLASKFFIKVKELGMMSEGYGWIVTDGVTNNLNSLDSSVIDSMQGTIGIRPYPPSSENLNNFSLKWRSKLFQGESNVFCLWAYDAVWALAIAAEKVGLITSRLRKNSTSMLSYLASTTSLSHVGSELLKAILQSKFEGLSGEIELQSGQLQPVAFQILNVNGKESKEIGFWAKRNGLTQVLDLSDDKVYAARSVRGLKSSIRWPGISTAIPRGWKMSAGSTGKRLRIGVPIKTGFKELVKLEFDSQTNAPTVSGFCIDVFRAAVEQLPYAVAYDFIPFTNSYGRNYYNDLIDQVYLQKFDGAVGDITILANRTLYVDFTIPFTELGVGMIVPVGSLKTKSMWIFLEPLTLDLWLGSGAFFIWTGCVVLLIERGVNKEFKQPLAQQLGTLFWYSFSTLVFAQWEKLMSKLSKFVVIIWLFVVLILTSSYTASLSSLLTLHQLQLLPKGGVVGFPGHSAVRYMVNNNQLGDAALKPLDSVDDYYNALREGNTKDGVCALVDEIPYLKLFLSRYSAHYTMIEPSHRTTNGFGFVFQKGSPLAIDMSAAIAKLREDGKLQLIEETWYHNHSVFKNQESQAEPNILNFYSFRGLFLLTGACSMFALIMFYLFPKNRPGNRAEPEADNQTNENTTACPANILISTQSSEENSNERSTLSRKPDGEGN